MGKAPMFGRRRAARDTVPYTPFFTPPYNEAKVLAIGQPVGHLESDVLGLRGYSIESIGGMPDLIETSYCPFNWAEMQPDVPVSSVRTGLSFDGQTADELDDRSRRQLLVHASTHIKNNHAAWRPMLGHSGFERESSELRQALEDRPEFTIEVDLDGSQLQAVAIEHLGDRFARVILLDDGIVLTIAGRADIFANPISLRLPSAS